MKLVDSSAWIDFFRSDKAAVKRVDNLLSDGEAAITGAVFAEVIRVPRTVKFIPSCKSCYGDCIGLIRLHRLGMRLPKPRFTLARRGIQAHLVDLLIAVTAGRAGTSLSAATGISSG